MIHPITALQGALIAALAGDPGLAGLLGGAIYDAPGRGAAPPYVAIARHEVVPRDGDLTPGYAHRLVLDIWHADASRKSALAIAERLVDVALGAALASEGWRVTNRAHERTASAIDLATGYARAAVTLRFFTEPDS